MVWDFLCGDLRQANVTINTYKIPEELRGQDYSNNDELRAKLKAFLEEIWEEKDQIIESKDMALNQFFRLIALILLSSCSNETNKSDID